jgi:integrase
MSYLLRGPRIFASLCEDYISSPKFQGLAENSKQLWARELRDAGDLEKLGSYSLKEIRPSLIQGYLDGLDGRPGKQAAALAALKAIEKWAVVRDLLPRDITKGVESGRPRGGHVPWSDEQVAQAEKFARADIARAIVLGANTGQRISDLVRMRGSDVEAYKGRQGINVTQKKTGRQVWIPISLKLATAIAEWEVKDGLFLTTKRGKPWSAIHLRQTWDYEKKINPNLKEHRQLGLVLHGLRGHCCVRLSREGLTDHQISDIVGMSIPMVGRYTRLSSQRDNALAALYGTRGEHR